MSKSSKFNYQTLNTIKKRSLTVSSFAGVDYTSQKFLVSDGRAIDELNYVYRGGFIQKRNGVRECYKLEPTEYRVYEFDGTLGEETKTNGTNFNGMWKFEGEDGNTHIVAHIGKLLYVITNIGDDSKMKISPIIQFTSNAQNYCYEFEDRKSFAFVGSKKLWFLGGNKYMCIRFTENGVNVSAVENNKGLTPIPTTTISITYSDAITSGNRTSLDRPNIMTQWRKNMLVSGVTKSEYSSSSQNYEYILDAPIIVKNRDDINDMRIIIESRGEIE